MERSWAASEATRASCSCKVRVVAWRPERVVTECRRKVVSFALSGATSRSCSAVTSSIAWRSEVVIAWSCAETRARASPLATPSREISSSSARCAGSRRAQMYARCPRWGGGPSLTAKKARGSGAVGRKPGVRPVLDPVVARRSVGA